MAARWKTPMLLSQILTGAVTYGEHYSAPRPTSQNVASTCITVQIHSGLTIDHILWTTGTFPFLLRLADSSPKSLSNLIHHIARS